jgi:hypothetical protein
MPIFEQCASRTRLVAALVALSSCACGGGILASSDADAGPTDGLPTSDAAPTPTSYTAAQVSTALATCGAPHGNPYTPENTTDCANHVVGAWYLCSTTGQRPELEPAQSMRLAPDGSFQYLVSDGDGGLITGQGPTEEGTFVIVTDCNGGSRPPNSPCVHQLGSPPQEFIFGYTVTGGGGGGQVLFEASPARMELQDELPSGANWEAWYVPL